MSDSYEPIALRAKQILDVRIQFVSLSSIKHPVSSIVLVSIAHPVAREPLAKGDTLQHIAHYGSQQTLKFRDKVSRKVKQSLQTDAKEE